MPNLEHAAADELTAVQTMLSAAQRRMEEVTKAIEPLGHERAVLEVRVKMLKELLGTYVVTPDAVTSIDAAGSAYDNDSPSGPESTAERVRRQVSVLLSDAGRPLHTNDIHARFLERGWPIPGAGNPGNITAHLSHAPDVYSPQRGFWTLGPNPNSADNPGSKQAKRNSNRKVR